MIIAYYLALIALTVFSFGFIDANFPIRVLPFLYDFVHNYRPIATAVYITLVTFLFVFYLWILRQKNNPWKVIFFTCIILFIAFPAFSYDIFNYIATAKIAFFYKENPYVMMPIEFTKEPMLAYLHAANKTALYGPTWISLTLIPYLIGLGNILLTIYSFKALILVFYLGVCWLLWRMGGDRALRFFALNPIVLTETLVSGHNDITMMFLALMGFYMAQHKKYWLGLVLLLLSVFVKGATVVLIPIYLLSWTTKQWSNAWLWSAMLLLLVFFLTPFREELYAWYFIWPLTFISLLPKNHFLQTLSHGFTLGLPLRFAPFVYFGQWGGKVPILKKLVSLLPPMAGVSLYVAKKSH